MIRVLIARRYSFNSQPLEGGCHEVPRHIDPRKAFQLTAARRRLLARPAKPRHARVFQLTAARRRLRGFRFWGSRGGWVSTHSRSKAAALSDVISIRPNQAFQLTAARRRLLVIAPLQIRLCRFQLTAARRRLPPWSVSFRWGHYVSTHSRSKAAANYYTRGALRGDVSTHSRSKAAAVTNTAWSKQGEFQLTAARRRLPAARQLGLPRGKV